MKKEDMMPIVAAQATMWTLSADRKTVRLALPPLSVDGIPERSIIFPLLAMARRLPASWSEQRSERGEVRIEDVDGRQVDDKSLA